MSNRLELSDRVVIKKKLDEWLDEVDYAWLNDGTYVPSGVPFGM